MNDPREKAIHAEQHALAVLRRVAESFDWQGQPEGSIDIIGCDPKGVLFAVEVKRLRGPNRTKDLKGAMAMAILHLQRHAPGSGKIVWVHVDNIGQQVIETLGTYLNEMAPDVGWALVDSHGGMHLHLPALGLEIDEASATPRRAPALAGAMFSDLNMWLLKILLMRESPAWAWTATREQPRNVRALASLAAVSDTKAHRFAKKMSEAGFLRAGSKGLELVRIESLLLAWRAAYQGRVVPLVAARPIFDFDVDSLRLPPDLRVALGGQLAAQRLKLSHATHGREVIWIDGTIEDGLASFDLVPAQAQQGNLYIGRPPYPESLFRGRLNQGHVPIIDPCELMLESMLDPQRGVEQSDYVMGRILEWQPR